MEAIRSKPSIEDLQAMLRDAERANREEDRRAELAKLGLELGDVVYECIYEGGPVQTPSLRTEHSRNEQLTLPKYWRKGDRLEAYEGDRKLPSPPARRLSPKEAEGSITLQMIARVRALQSPIARAVQDLSALDREIKNAEGVRDAAIARIETLKTDRQVAAGRLDTINGTLESFFEGRSDEWRAGALAEAARTDRDQLPPDNTPLRHTLPRPEGSPRMLRWNPATRQNEEVL